MRKWLSFLLVAGALLVSSAASAQGWFKGCQMGVCSVGGASCAEDSDCATGTCVGTPSSKAPTGTFTCTDLNANENSEMLSVTQCDNIDILFYPDVSSIAPASGNTANVYSCAAPTDVGGVGPTDGGWSTERCFIVQNLLFDGNPATNTEGLLGYAAEWIYVDIVTYVAETARVVVRCNP